MKSIIMGSICSSLNNQDKRSSCLPPQDLSALLINYEKELPDSSYWFEKFDENLRNLDTTTQQAWRADLLDFVVVARRAIKLGLDSEDTLNSLKEYLEEGGVGVSDYTLRESLADEIDKLIEYSRGGAKSTRAVLQGKGGGQAVAVEKLKQVLLDPGVWKVLEGEYMRFLKRNPPPPTLAVIMSIL